MRVETAAFRIRVQLVEIGDAQREIGIGEQLDRLRLSGTDHQLGDAPRPIRVDAVLLLRGGTVGEQVHERVRRLHGLRIILRRADHDAARMQIVVQGVALTQEFRREQDTVIVEPFANLLGVTNRNRRLDDDPCGLVVLADCLDRRLHAGRVEVVLLGVVIRRRGYHCVIRSRIRLFRVERRLEVQRPLAGPVRIEECGDLAIHDGALAVVEQLDLLRHDVQRVHLIMLRQQQRHRQSDVTSTGNRNLHGTLLLRCATRNSNYD